MSITRQTRFIFWLLRDLAIKYTRSLILGFFVGFLASIIFWRLFPTYIKPFFMPVDRIGIIGEFTPSNLPLFIQNQISLGLTTIGEDGLPHAGLASWWEATDSGKTYVFHMKDDSLCHNGKSISAEDVNYNIKSVTFSVKDPKTLVAKLDFPYSPFPVLMSKPIFLEGLVGCGPYKVSKIGFKGNDISELRLVPTIKKTNTHVVEYYFYQTEALAILAYKLGQIDKIEDLTNPQDLVKWGQTKVIENIKMNRIVTLFFNLKDSLLSEKNLRQALGYTIDLENQKRALSPISSLSWGYTDKVRKYTYDKEQAKKLFNETKIGTSAAEFTLSTFPLYLDIAQTIANSWNHFGFKTTVKVENSLPSNYQMILSAIDIPPDPDQYPLWHSTQTSTNITNYMNVKIDKLLEDGRQEMDPEKRKKIYADFARRIVDDSPAIFLYYPKTYTIERGK